MLGTLGAGIDDVDQKRSFGHLFERGAEGTDQSGGEVPNKADGIAEKYGSPRGQLDGAHGGIEGCEHSGVGEHSGVREPIEERRLSRVGITYEGDGG